MSVGKHAITDPKQLRGKRVGTAGIPYQSAYLRRSSRGRGPADDGAVVNVGFNLVPSMISGRVDATLGAFWNIEGVELSAATASRRSCTSRTSASRPTTSS